MAEKPSVSTRIPLEWKQELTKIAEEHDISISQILHDLIGQLLCKQGVDRVCIVDGKLQRISPNSDLQAPKAVVNQALTESTAQFGEAEIQALTVSPDDIPEPLPSVQPIATRTRLAEPPRQQEPLDNFSTPKAPSVPVGIEPEPAPPTISEVLELSEVIEDAGTLKQDSWASKILGTIKTLFLGAPEKVPPADISPSPTMPDPELTDRTEPLLEKAGDAEQVPQQDKSVHFLDILRNANSSEATDEQKEEWSRLSPEQIDRLVDDLDFQDCVKFSQWYWNVKI